MNYWLMKSEPDTFSFDDLVAMPKMTDHWDGIRNYQARNFMRDQFKTGDKVLFYHSNTKPPGIIGTAVVTSAAYPDHTAFDKKQKYFDPKSDPENPRWFMVDVQAKAKFKNYIGLPELKANEDLDGMLVIKKGQRLSIQPVEKQHFDLILKLGKPKKV